MYINCVTDAVSTPFMPQILHNSNCLCKRFKVGYLFCLPVDASAVVSVSVVVSNKKTWGDTRWIPFAVIAGV